MECSYKNRSHWKNISKEKFRRHVFVVYVLIYPLSKFGGNRTNSPWVLAFYSVRFKWKNWFEKTALNMPIRWVICTCGQYLKPPFLCQYLIFFNYFFWIIALTKNRNLKKLSIWRYTVTLINDANFHFYSNWLYLVPPTEQTQRNITSFWTVQRGQQCLFCFTLFYSRTV